MKENTVNNAGAPSFAVSPMDRLRRFLILGSENSTFYQSAQALTSQNTKNIASLIASDGLAVVAEIVEFSENNRAPKKEPALFALALCTVSDDVAVRKAAYNAMGVVCGIPTHLFTFIDNCEALSKQIKGSTGWARLRKDAVAKWYNELSTRDLVYRTTKYKQRNGWSNRDLIRLAHVKPIDSDHDLVYKYIVKGELELNIDSVDDKDAFKRLVACDQIQSATSAKEVVKFVTDFNLMREHIPTQFLKEPSVWEALLQNMPLNALLRNVGRLTSLGLLDNGSKNSKLVLEKFGNEVALKKAKLHPFNVLIGYNAYKSGGTAGKGSLRWKPTSDIKRGLDKLFYSSFEYVESAEKRFLLGVDVSASMGWTPMNNSSMNCSTGAAAMAMTIARTEPNSTIMGFSNGLVDLGLSKNDSLEEVERKVLLRNFGGTNCAAPIQHALHNNIEVDTFIIITDNDTGSTTSVASTLRKYRKKTGIDAKLIVIAMSSSGFTIADPSDRGMLDMVGFDSSAPRIIRDFSIGAF